MLQWLRRIFAYTPGEFDLYRAHNRMPPARVRPYSPADYDTCRGLYTLNEPGRFPPGILPQFESALQSGRALYLIAEDDHGICGCGGINILGTSHNAWLSFGLIHPDRQSQGFGTMLLLARLALLPNDNWRLLMSTVQASGGFYERFGFCVGGQMKGSNGEDMPVHYARLSPDVRSQCAALLKHAGVELQTGNAKVPAVS